ncbi:uncharacterized mitochondrial protein AtMg00860-like [Typha latifolia]|uniref:uncharacterized mitochondrial protein AtMg00860-like n=1 Tax=Typha latifolia TaxID=4733 RepID=UPI003C2F6EBE
MEILQAHGMKVKKSKCLWGQPRVEYLGHFISSAGVEVVPAKVASMVRLPRSKMPKELRGFLRLTGYYRRFIQVYGKIATSLTALLRKGRFEWDNKAERAFEEFKQAMIEAPMLALPNFTKTFVVECDASRSGIGTILMQEGHSIAYMSKALSQRLRQSSMYK